MTKEELTDYAKETIIRYEYLEYEEYMKNIEYSEDGEFLRGEVDSEKCLDLLLKHEDYIIKSLR